MIKNYNKTLNKVLKSSYKYGFYSKFDNKKLPLGINEDIIKDISNIKKEPKWLCNYRLNSYNNWIKMKEPNWANVTYKKINYDKICYYSEPNVKNNYNKYNEEFLNTMEKLDIFNSYNKKLKYNKKVIDIVMDSISVSNNYNRELKKLGIIFCSFSEAVNKYPDLVKKYLGSVVLNNDNFFVALNSSVFSDGSFCYIPPYVKCPIELSTYFRINEANIGQFERTLIIADKGSYVSYLEGCSAARHIKNQLHAAVVELVALESAKIKYSTIQNWYPGNKDGKGGILNFVTKRGICNKNSSIYWVQVETGSNITWKYPSCILNGDNSVGKFYSISLTKGKQQCDTGSKMIHIGNNSKSFILSKSISAGKSINNFRSLVKILNNSNNSRNFTQCDSLIISNKSESNTFPTIINNNNSSNIEHEATTSKINEEQLLYCQQRGIKYEKALSMIIVGYSREIINKLPLEFAIEAKNMLDMTLDGVIG